MSYGELFVSPSSVFAGNLRSLEDAEYTILGIPLDVTSTFRSGARFAPLAIREASQNLEGYSFRTGISIEDLKIHDLGDLHVAGDIGLTLGRLALVAQNLFDDKNIPVFMGGEHTITLGIIRNLEENVVVVSFDAHLDLRDNYLGLSLSHTTFMRRIKEDVKPCKILEIGTRAVCKEELDYAKRSGIQFLTATQIRKDGVEKMVKTINRILEDYKKIYITIDMDVLDPAFAPAVQNPEPEGLDTTTLLDLLKTICDRRVIGVDLVEVTPHYDRGLTATLAAKILFELLCCLEKARKG
jgi:agmatinase